MLNFISPFSLAQRVQPQSLSQWGEFFCWLVFPCFHFLCSSHVQPIPYHLCFSTHCSQQDFGVNFPHQGRSGTALPKGMQMQQWGTLSFLPSTTQKSSLLTESRQGELWHCSNRLLRVSLRRLSQFPWCWTCSVLRECFAYRKVFGSFPQHWQVLEFPCLSWLLRCCLDYNWVGTNIRGKKADFPPLTPLLCWCFILWPTTFCSLNLFSLFSGLQFYLHKANQEWVWNSQGCSSLVYVTHCSSVVVSPCKLISRVARFIISGLNFLGWVKPFHLLKKSWEHHHIEDLKPMWLLCWGIFPRKGSCRNLQLQGLVCCSGSRLLMNINSSIYLPWRHPDSVIPAHSDVIFYSLIESYDLKWLWSIYLP